MVIFKIWSKISRIAILGMSDKNTCNLFRQDAHLIWSITSDPFSTKPRCRTKLFVLSNFVEQFCPTNFFRRKVQVILTGCS